MVFLDIFVYSDLLHICVFSQICRCSRFAAAGSAAAQASYYRVTEKSCPSLHRISELEKWKASGEFEQLIQEKGAA